MTVYRCYNCGNTFDEPVRVKYRENLDGENGWQTVVDEYCPFCGDQWFEEVSDDSIEEGS